MGSSPSPPRPQDGHESYLRPRVSATRGEAPGRGANQTRRHSDRRPVDPRGTQHRHRRRDPTVGALAEQLIHHPAMRRRRTAVSRWTLRCDHRAEHPFAGGPDGLIMHLGPARQLAGSALGGGASRRQQILERVGALSAPSRQPDRARPPGQVAVLIMRFDDGIRLCLRAANTCVDDSVAHSSGSRRPPATGEGQGHPVLERTRSAMAPGGGGVEGDEVEFVRAPGEGGTRRVRRPGRGAGRKRGLRRGTCRAGDLDVGGRTPARAA